MDMYPPCGQRLTLLGGLPARLRKRDRLLLAARSGRDAVEHVRQESAEDALYTDHLVPRASQILMVGSKNIYFASQRRLRRES